MSVAQPHIISEENPFIARETDLRILHNRPLRLHGGGILLCQNGNAVISIDTQFYDLRTDAQVILLPGSVVMIESADSDFRVVCFYFTRQLFEEAHRQFDPTFFHHLKHAPVYYHSPVSAMPTLHLLNLIVLAYADMSNDYRTEIVSNYLRIILLNVYDKVQRNVLRKTPEEYTRKEELYHRFIRLILENCTHHRDVEFYADKLCISKRYLDSVTRATVGESPKYTIDKHLIQEIKTLLAFSDMPLQQMADYLHFPDQSYLGRYFKRHTGQSLMAYRSSI